MRKQTNQERERERKKKNKYWKISVNLSPVRYINIEVRKRTFFSDLKEKEKSERRRAPVFGDKLFCLCFLSFYRSEEIKEERERKVPYFWRQFRQKASEFVAKSGSPLWAHKRIHKYVATYSLNKHRE